MTMTTDVFSETVAERPVGIDLSTERRYAEIMLAIRAHEDDVKDLKEQAAVLEAQLLETWAEQGCNQIRVDGRLLFLQETTFAALPQGKEAAVALLKGSDFANVVQETVNANTLSALVRELKSEGRLPSDWQGVIEPGSKFNIRVRK